MELLYYIAIFAVVIVVLVFVHEYGHYWVAKRNGVKIESFSIGFGPELAGFTDRDGTRWKLCPIPLGGYVKMYGDADEASTGPSVEAAQMTAAERDQSFFAKTVGQRAAIVFAGPAANFLFALVVMAILFTFAPHPFPKAEVGGVAPGSAAEQAGLLPGDRITAVDGVAVGRFFEIAVAMRANQGEPVSIALERDGVQETVVATPTARTVELEDGSTAETYVLGVSAPTEALGPIDGTVASVTEFWNISALTVSALAGIIAGGDGAEDLGGPIRIAQISGDIATVGIVPFVWLLAVLSINLGLINLFPIPMLDGGHLVFYAAEAVRGKPLSDRIQEYSFRIGQALILLLIVFVFFNDIRNLNLF